MSRRGMILGLLVLTAVLGGALWWKLDSLSKQAELDRAGRLGAPGIRVPQTQTPVNADGTLPTVSFVPVRKLEPVLAGKVLRAADDSPLDGAVVEVLGGPGADGLPLVLCRTNTVPDGGFALTAPNLAPTALRIWYPVHYRPATPPPEKHAGFQLGQCVVQTVPLAAGDERRLDLVLRIDTGWILSGKLTDPAGKPVADGLVNIAEPREISALDEQGRFTIRDLPPDGTTLSLTASGGRVRTAVFEVTPPQGGAQTREFDIELSPAGLIYGRVLWRRGLSKPSNPPVIMVLNPPKDALPGAAETRTAIVDEDLNYRLDGLGPGTWDLSCAWTTSEGQVQRTWVTYVRGLKIEGGEQVLHEFLLPDDATLDIRVTDADGAPLADHLVEVCHVLDPENPGSPVLREAFMVTAADGTCALDELAPGTKELNVLSKPAQPAPGMPPAPPEKLATQRVAVVNGLNPVTLVVGPR